MLLWTIAACLQCALLYGLWRGARNIILPSVHAAATSSRESLSEEYSQDLPRVGMIIPAAGNHPAMPQAIASLLEQDYPHITPVIVTASEDDPAYALAQTLQQPYPALQCVVAGEATQCGQKNHNTLKAVEYLGDTVDVYVFCDSTHMAKSNFVRELVLPIANNEAGFTTGYHNVVAQDTQKITLAYQISVLLMRFLQAVAVFTQPWGGAMAIARKVFIQHKIANFWKDNVVDDCSLAAMLLQRRLHVQLCPLAILETDAKDHSLPVWQAWMQRQVLFLKFCVMPQWFLLGAFAVLMTLPVVISCLYILGGLTNILPHSFGWNSVFACAHLIVLVSIVLAWRELLPQKTPAFAWIQAFFLSCGMFLKVYLQTIPLWHIDWHGYRYVVNKSGKVRHMTKI